MRDLLPGARPAAALALSLACCVAVAGTPAPSQCAAPSPRAASLKVTPGGNSLADLSIAVAGGEARNLTRADVTLLQGPCADGAYAHRMGMVFFTDGMVFSVAPDGRVEHVPRLAGLTNFGGEPLSADHPPMENARFVMASNVAAARVANERRSLDVGLWQADDGYVVAAYTRHGDRFGAPVELLRSTRPVRSVTYFPSPDAPSGRLGLVTVGEDGIALVGIDWHHRDLSRKLLSVD